MRTMMSLTEKMVREKVLIIDPLLLCVSVFQCAARLNWNHMVNYL